MLAARGPSLLYLSLDIVDSLRARLIYYEIVKKDQLPIQDAPRSRYVFEFKQNSDEHCAQEERNT